MNEESLKLPSQLLYLISKGAWKHPGDDKLKELVPFLGEPIDFLYSKEQMDFNSGPLMDNNETESCFFHEYRGSAFSDVRDLPWIDVEKSIMIAVNRSIGDDLGIALDYRTSSDDPRVIASDWSENECMWREIAPTFSTFCSMIELVPDNA
ncbi:hypothetical protein [Cerasicoccus frondis]|uniref:hypothetical protein n=1 Tax=Cerasicoccus frondis TaxID=490090 RepID=UPI002852ABD1|nr:hypothetical protein [Cerasicoccus frondis]